MTFWSRRKKTVRGKEAAPPPAIDAFSQVRWLPASDNFFGIDLLDCQSVAASMIAVTTDQQVAESFVKLRTSCGEQYRGRVPEDATTFDCSLGYPAAGETREGPVFRAEVMEDKWDIYLYEGHLYFTRSWTGELVYRAKIVFQDDGTRVTAVEVQRGSRESDPSYPVAVIDFLMLSHLYGLPMPHPLPKSIGSDPYEIATFSFSQYGRRGRFGTFADTAQLPIPPREQARERDTHSQD